jgi:hypothetical protein
VRRAERVDGGDIDDAYRERERPLADGHAERAARTYL